MNNKVGIYGLLSQSIKLLSGPLSLLVLSSQLTVDELFFYFSFFSIIAFQQVIEAGLSFVIRQKISSSYPEDIKKIYSYFCLSIVWYLAISIFIILVIGIAGIYYYDDYTGDISWKTPWWTITVMSAIFCMFFPVQILVESCQKQVILYKARSIASVVSSVALIISLYNEFGLFSASILVFFSNIIIYILIYRDAREILSKFRYIKKEKHILQTFKSIRKVMFKIATTWIMGYFLWNSFSLIVYKVIDIEMAGKFALAYSLVRTGYYISGSIVNSQVTLFSNMISTGNFERAIALYNKSKIASLGIMIIGYLVGALFYMFFPEFYIFDKLPSLDIYALICLFFLTAFMITSDANFSRCIGDEPYFYHSLFMNTAIPLFFYIFIYHSIYAALLSSVFINVGLFVWSRKIFNHELDVIRAINGNQ